MKLIQYSGYYLVATGMIHNLLGVLLGWDTLNDMHRLGWFSSTVVEGRMLFDREAISWFLISGCFWVLFGLLLQKALDHGVVPPTSLGWGFVVMGAVVAFIMPVSGAYLFIIQGGILIYGRRQMLANQNKTLSF